VILRTEEVEEKGSKGSSVHDKETSGPKSHKGKSTLSQDRVGINLDIATGEGEIKRDPLEADRREDRLLEVDTRALPESGTREKRKIKFIYY
jgi:hypothetical protein